MESIDLGARGRCVRLDGGRGIRPTASVRISLDDAIRLALQHNHTLLAARTTIDQSKDEEITAYLRPNPELFGDWDYLPLFSPSSFTGTYFNQSTEVDLGLSYLIERGKKRQRRLAGRQGPDRPDGVAGIGQ